MIKFAELEEKILASWQERKIFAKTLAKPTPRGDFIFFEGPPTANGKPGLHHVLARAFKDLIPRYKTMRGFRVDRKAGWDTQGLPVELEVEKELKFRSKPDIEKYGIKEFNEHCRQNVWKYKADWEKLTERIGFWLDLEKPYITYEPYYIESLWWILKQVWETKVNGGRLLYKDYKVVPHCPRCGTALSSHEVAQGYQSVTEPAVFVKFKVKPGQKVGNFSTDDNTYILSWTTTSWTLPGNVALAVGKDIEYILASIPIFSKGTPLVYDSFDKINSSKIPDLRSELFIVAKDTADKVFKDLSPLTYEVVKTVTGNDLVGLEYEPLFDIKPLQNDKSYRVYAADFVTTTDGTGVVHTAVMYGEDDFNLGAEIGLPKFHTVDDNGLFTAEVGEWAGKFVKDKEVEQGIMEDLEKRGLLFKQEMYTHDYPYCWRCSTPLLYYAKPSWFIRMSVLRAELKQGNEKINWYPGHIKDGRFGEWLDGAKDWAISRERYWGTPLPIWVCENCHEQICVGSFQELSDLTNESQKSKISAQGGSASGGKSQNFNPHRPFVDEIELSCKCGGQMKRVPEVADCWFDSGSMPFAQWGYPATAGSGELFKEHYPAEFIAEAIDQTRGWFYTLLAIATLLKKSGAIDGQESPYKNVICLGHINDKYGQKMSKSKGNVVDPWEVINQYGADALRFHFYTANQPGEPKNFDPKDVEEVIKRTFLILFNVVSFYELYKTDGLETTQPSAVNVLDKWILALAQKLVNEVTEHLEKYEITEAGRKIVGFVNELSTWYVRRSRERFKEAGEDKLQALQTLGYVLQQLSLMMAPFTPFIAEEIYHRVGGRQESVHLENWPQYLSITEEEKSIISSMLDARVVIEGVLSIRASKGMKVRQPLRCVAVWFGSESWKPSKDIENIILEEVNILEWFYPSDDEGITKLLSYDFTDVIIPSRAGWSVPQAKVFIDTGLDDELRALGLIREFSRQVNALRKQQGLTINDRIALKVGASEKITAILSKHRDNLLRSTLSKEINISQEAYGHKLEIEGEAVTVEIS